MPSAWWRKEDLGKKKNRGDEERWKAEKSGGPSSWELRHELPILLRSLSQDTSLSRVGSGPKAKDDIAVEVEGHAIVSGQSLVRIPEIRALRGRCRSLEDNGASNVRGRVNKRPISCCCRRTAA
ncbi:hypothetical protein KM043_002352 [Ampulex compressa]|nr:hypothetical protein KM043_002352 [Ampulex compressa]